MLDRNQILQALEGLAADLESRGVTGELFVVGGGAMALAYSNERVTKDIDALFEPKAVVYEAAQRVAEQLGLEPNWLNDAMKAFLHGADADATVYFEQPGLSVRVASPRYLFIMKAMASRESDYDDLRVLYRLAGLASAREAFDLIESSYPRAAIKPIVQYVIEGIAAEVGKGGDPA